MKIITCAQRSQEWYERRLGIPTASEFHKIITPKTRKISEQAAGYAHILLAEWLTGQQVENAQTEWMVRGTELEESAVAAYELCNDVQTEPAPFFMRDDEMVGCTPDRLVGERKILEIKSCLAHNQIQALLNPKVDEKHRCQIQGQLWLTERDEVDLFSYHPIIPSATMTIARDEGFIKYLATALDAFVETLLKCRVLLIERYGVTPAERKAAVAEDTRFDITDADVDALIASRRGGAE